MEDPLDGLWTASLLPLPPKKEPTPTPRPTPKKKLTSTSQTLFALSPDDKDNDNNTPTPLKPTPSKPTTQSPSQRVQRSLNTTIAAPPPGVPRRLTPAVKPPPSRTLNSMHSPIGSGSGVARGEYGHGSGSVSSGLGLGSNSNSDSMSTPMKDNTNTGNGTNTNTNGVTGLTSGLTLTPGTGVRGDSMYIGMRRGAGAGAGGGSSVTPRRRSNPSTGISTGVGVSTGVSTGTPIDGGIGIGIGISEDSSVVGVLDYGDNGGVVDSEIGSGDGSDTVATPPSTQQSFQSVKMKMNIDTTTSLPNPTQTQIPIPTNHRKTSFARRTSQKTLINPPSVSLGGVVYDQNGNSGINGINGSNNTTSSSSVGRDGVSGSGELELIVNREKYGDMKGVYLGLVGGSRRGVFRIDSARSRLVVNTDVNNTTVGQEKDKDKAALTLTLEEEYENLMTRKEKEKEADSRTNSNSNSQDNYDDEPLTPPTPSPSDLVKTQSECDELSDFDHSALLAANSNSNSNSTHNASGAFSFGSGSGSILNTYNLSISSDSDHPFNDNNKSYISTGGEGSTTGGSLQKTWRGYMLKKSPGFLGRWQSRFLSVGNGVMFYAKTGKADSPELGEVILVGSRVTVTTKKVGKVQERTVTVGYDKNGAERCYVFKTVPDSDKDSTSKDKDSSKKEYANNAKDVVEVIRECRWKQHISFIYTLCKGGSDEDSGLSTIVRKDKFKLALGGTFRDTTLGPNNNSSGGGGGGGRSKDGHSRTSSTNPDSGDEDTMGDSPYMTSFDDMRMRSSSKSNNSEDDNDDDIRDSYRPAPMKAPKKTRGNRKTREDMEFEEHTVKAHVRLKALLEGLEEGDKRELIDFVDRSGQTWLHVAAKHGSSRVIRVLMEYYSPQIINQKDVHGRTALNLALSKCNNKTALALLDFGPHDSLDASVKNDEGDTYLHCASGCDRVIIRRLISLGVDVGETNVLGLLPHQEMAVKGNSGGLEELLLHDVSVIDKKGSKDGYSPLHWAVKEGHGDTVKMLLKLGADPELVSHTGNTPIHVCIHYYVERSKVKKQAKSIGYHKKFTAIIIDLIDAGANLEFISKEGRSALSGLCRIEPEFNNNKFGGQEAFDHLIDNGSLITVRSSKGFQPIHYAADAGNWAMVKVLIDHGADVNARGADGFTALNYVEKKLASKGARVKYGHKFPLMGATVKMLLENGAVRNMHKDVPIEESTHEITYLRNNVDGTYLMKAATIPAMIARLTHRVFYNTSDVYAFLLQYDKYTNPVEILTCLKSRFFQTTTLLNFPDTFAMTETEHKPEYDLAVLGERRSVLAFIEQWLSTNDGNPACFSNLTSPSTIYLSELVESIMNTGVIPAIQEDLEPLALLYFGDFCSFVHQGMWNVKWRLQQGFIVPAQKYRSEGVPVKRQQGDRQNRDHEDEHDDDENEEDEGRTSRTSSLQADVTFDKPELVEHLAYTSSTGPDFSNYDIVLSTYAKHSSSTTKSTPKSKKSIFNVLKSNVNSQVLAQQLTLLTHALFCEIPVSEFVDSRYKDPETGSNFQRLKKATNKLSFVLLSWILKEEDAGDRAKVIKLLLQTAENALKIDNFDLFITLVSVLGSSSIHRLKHTWTLVSLMLPGKFEALQRASGGAGRNLESKMTNLKPPCVPCIGLVLRMLINLNEEPSLTPSNTALINFHKLRKSGNILTMIDASKLLPYSFAVNVEVLEGVCGTPEFGDEEGCWARSRVVEAKGFEG